MTYELHVLFGSDTGVLVQTAVEEFGLVEGKDYTIDWFQWNELQTPEHGQHQPYKRSPWMKDTATGVELYESRVICKYIASKIKSPLMPAVDPSSEAYWQFDKLCSVDLSMVYTWTAPLMVEYFYAVHFYGREIKADVVENHEHELKRALIGHEAILAQQQYLFSDEFTLVDMFEQGTLKMVHDNGGAKYLTDGTYPNIKRWYEAITARPAFVKAFEDKMAAFKQMVEYMKSQGSASH